MSDEKIVLEATISWSIIMPHIILCLFIVGFVTLPFAIIRRKTTKLIIKEKSIYGKYGIINLEIMESPINKITSVKVSQNLDARMMKYGTLYINTAAGNFVFKYIKNPYVIQKIILELMN